METTSIPAAWLTDLVDLGGVLLVLPLMLPVVGLLLALVLGGRYLSRVTPVLMAAGVAAALLADQFGVVAPENHKSQTRPRNVTKASPAHGAVQPALTGHRGRSDRHREARASSGGLRSCSFVTR